MTDRRGFDFLNYHLVESRNGLRIMLGFMAVLLVFIATRVWLDLHAAKSEAEIDARRLELVNVERDVEARAAELALYSLSASDASTDMTEDEPSFFLSRASMVSKDPILELKRLNPEGTTFLMLSREEAEPRLQSALSAGREQARKWGLRLDEKVQQAMCDPTELRRVSGIMPAIRERIRNETNRLLKDRTEANCYDIPPNVMKVLRASAGQSPADAMPMAECNEDLREALLTVYLATPDSSEVERYAQSLQVDCDRNTGETRSKRSTSPGIERAKIQKLLNMIELPTGDVEEFNRVIGDLEKAGQRHAEELEREASDLRSQAREKRKEVATTNRQSTDVKSAQFWLKLFLFCIVSLVCLLGVNAGFKLSRGHSHEVAAIRRWEILDSVLERSAGQNLVITKDILHAIDRISNNPFSPRAKGSELSTPHVELFREIIQEANAARRSVDGYPGPT